MTTEQKDYFVWRALQIFNDEQVISGEQALYWVKGDPPEVFLSDGNRMPSEGDIEVNTTKGQMEPFLKHVKSTIQEHIKNERINKGNLKVVKEAVRDVSADSVGRWFLSRNEVATSSYVPILVAFFVSPMPDYPGGVPFLLSQDPNEALKTQVSAIAKFYETNVPGFPGYQVPSDSLAVPLRVTVLYHSKHGPSKLVVKAIDEHYQDLEHNNKPQPYRLLLNLIDLHDNSDAKWGDFDQAEAIFVVLSSRMISPRYQPVWNKLQDFSTENEDAPIVVRNMDVEPLTTAEKIFGTYGPLVDLPENSGHTGLLALLKKSILRTRSLRQESINDVNKLTALLQSERKIRWLVMGAAVSCFMLCVALFMSEHRDEHANTLTLTSLFEDKTFSGNFYLPAYGDTMYVTSRKDNPKLYRFACSDHVLNKECKLNLEITQGESELQGIKDIAFVDSKIALVSVYNPDGIMQLEIDKEHFKTTWKNARPGWKDGQADSTRGIESDDIAVRGPWAVVTYRNSDKIGVVKWKEKDGDSTDYFLTLNQTKDATSAGASGVAFIGDNNIVVSVNNDNPNVAKLKIYNLVTKKYSKVKGAKELSNLADVKFSKVHNFIIACSDDNRSIYKAKITGKENEYHLADSIILPVGSPTDMTLFIQNGKEYALVVHRDHFQIDLLDIESFKIKETYIFEDPRKGKSDSGFFEGRGIFFSPDSGQLCISDGGRERVYCGSLVLD